MKDKQATWDQAGQFLNLVKENNPGRKQVQKLFESGFLSDLLDLEAQYPHREKFRSLLNLPPILAVLAPPSVQYRCPTSSLLTLLPGSEELIIAPASNEVIPDMTYPFASIDGDFRSYGADEPGAPTPPTPVGVYEMNTDGTFEGMFTSFDAPPDFFWLTHGQIINFVRGHRLWLRTDGCATFFPFKSRGNKFVAHVRLRSDGQLDVHVYRFGSVLVWYALYHRRVVVPQLAVL